jgi:hypothetical protein
MRCIEYFGTREAAYCRALALAASGLEPKLGQISDTPQFFVSYLI